MTYSIAKQLIFAVFALWLTATPSLSQTVVYETTGLSGAAPSLPATTVPSGFTASDVLRVNTRPRTTNNAFNSRNWVPNALDPAAGPSFYEWSLNFGSSPYDITDMDLGFRRSNNGPTDIELQVSVDAGSTWITVFTETGIPSATDLRTGVGAISDVDESLIPTVTGDIIFRLFGSNSGSGGGTFRITTFSGNAGINITAAPASVPVIAAEKDVLVVSDNGSQCSDFSFPAGSGSVAIPGACIEYHITIENSGSAEAADFTLTDILPDGLVFVGSQRSGWDETAPAPDAFSYAAPPTGTNCSSGACLIQLDNGIIQDGDTASITIRALVE